jgi:hypothetical protein
MVNVKGNSLPCPELNVQKGGSVSPFLKATKALGDSRGIALLCFLDLSNRRGEGLESRPGRFLPPRNTRYPLYRRLGERQGVWTGVETSPPQRFDPRTVQTLTSRYTDWAIPCHRGSYPCAKSGTTRPIPRSCTSQPSHYTNWANPAPFTTKKFQ